ncbi:MAG: hypothetical protein JW709_02955 [Sedimentisphaerales bacterium]|nr:hypothetical protein [Sedimentisphaerales bacterium]
MNVLHVLFIVLLCISSCLGADTCRQTPPAKTDTSDVPPAETPTTVPSPAPALPPVLDKLLDDIEQRGAKLKTFQADMEMTELQSLIDTLVERQGKLYYQADDQQVRFRVHFDSWRQMDLEEEEPAPTVKQDLDWVFDGLWLHKRDGRTKTLQSWEVSRQAARREDFSLGKGPFPLPFAVRKADILREFDIRLLDADPNDPPKTHHLLLIPREKSAFNKEYLRLEMWILQKELIPVKLLFEKTDYEIDTVTWTNWNIDTPIKSEDLALPPTPPGWTIERTPLPEEKEVKNISVNDTWSAILPIG